MSQLALGTPGLRNRPALRRRRVKNAVLVGLLIAAVVVAVGVLAWVLIYVAIQGVGALNLGFLTQTPPGNPASPGGGFYNGIVGGLIIVGIAALIAIPLGIGAAIYLVEYGRGQLFATIRFFNDVLIGIPTIVTGAFVYAIWVVKFGFSGFAGSLALAIVMLPLVTRTTRGDAASGAERASRGQPGAGGHAESDGDARLHPDGAAGDHHRRHAGSRARNGRDSSVAPDRARQ